MKLPKGSRWMTAGFFWLVVTVAVSGHAHLDSIDPASGSSVQTAPSLVRMTFTEPIELAFSNISVYTLPMTRGKQQPERAAETLVHSLFVSKADRLDAGYVAVHRGMSPTRGTSQSVDVKLADNLPASTYAIVWQVLSIDTHTTTGYSLFTISASD